MSGDTTMYAAGLGLIIPVVGISVCRKLWSHGLRAARGRAAPDGKGLLNVWFIGQVLVLGASCYAFNQVASSMQTEAEHFDPYHILDLPSRANATVIKSHYRRLSLKHHPDKNPGNRREANKKFNQVAKAYKALSDPEARRNWEQYGHPDGYQPWTFDLALPAWLRPGKDTDNGTLVLYGLGYMVVLLGFVLGAKVTLDLLDPAGGGKQPDFEVTDEDVKALLSNLDDTSSTADVLECLAACPQLCSEERRVLAGEMEAITDPLQDWLLEREGGAPPLRAPRSSSPPPPPQAAAAAAAAKPASRKGKGKGKGKNGSGKSKGGESPASGEEQAPAAAAGAGTKGEVDGEFFTQGRRGEGNRRTARESPELSRVVAHNLVVMLSALHRAPTPDAAVDGGVAVAPGGGENGDDGDDDEGSAGGVSTAGGDGKGARLLSAVSVAGRLAREQDLVFGLAEPLLDACMQVAARRASPQLLGTVVETKAMLRRRLWSSEDPAALERQREEVDLDLDAAVPSIKVKSVAVETWGESQVAVGDTVTATITIAREHAPEYQGLRRRRPEAGSLIAKGEPWWVMLAGGKGGSSLIRVTPMLVENLGSGIAECKMKFQAPARPGFVDLTVFVKSPVFVGVDCESTARFRVWRHDELKEDDDAGDW
ncbi:unnamed protein product [Ectocarpus sp. 6 AP-2014]